MFIDTHTHLNFKAFANDYGEVIERAKKAQVEYLICPSSNLETSKKAVEIAEKFPSVYAAVGLHAIHVKEETFDDEKFLKLAQNKKVVAVGETGLDYYYDRSTAELQKEVFEKHLKLAQKVGKPVIIHSREAYEDVISVLSAQSMEPKGVIHCYLGDWSTAQIFLEMGLNLSFTGIITFTKSHDLLNVIENVPLEKILIETDSPWLAPEPYRGKQNEPAFVAEVARKIAEIKKIDVDEVARVTTQNAIDLFELEL
jgi:TatD DNase family protein